MIVSVLPIKLHCTVSESALSHSDSHHNGSLLVYQHTSYSLPAISYSISSPAPHALDCLCLVRLSSVNLPDFCEVFSAHHLPLYSSLYPSFSLVGFMTLCLWVFHHSYLLSVNLCLVLHLGPYYTRYTQKKLYRIIKSFIFTRAKTDYYGAYFCAHGCVAFQIIRFDLKHSGDSVNTTFVKGMF